MKVSASLQDLCDVFTSISSHPRYLFSIDIYFFSLIPGNEFAKMQINMKMYLIFTMNNNICMNR